MLDVICVMYDKPGKTADRNIAESESIPDLMKINNCYTLDRLGGRLHILQKKFGPMQISTRVLIMSSASVSQNYFPIKC